MSVFPANKSMRNLLLSHSNRRNVLFKLQLISASIQQKFTFGSTQVNNNNNNNSGNQKARPERPESSRPELWYTHYPISLIGKRQSPINIQTEECLLNNRDLQLKPLIIEYPKQFDRLVLKNPRDDKFYGWRVDVFNEAEKTSLSGGPLEHNYRLAQFHCHWGKTCSCGSEHTIDGNYYSAELHLVHWNTDLYDSPNKALYSPNGLSVLAVFLQTCDQTNEEMSKLTEQMHRIRYKGQKITMNESIDILGLLPQQRSYWTYSGSLTTPPLWETVTWIVFKQPLLCTQQQIESFRQLSYRQKSEEFGDNNCDIDLNIEENYRSQQPLNERAIIFVKNGNNR